MGRRLWNFCSSAWDLLKEEGPVSCYWRSAYHSPFLLGGGYGKEGEDYSGRILPLCWGGGGGMLPAWRRSLLEKEATYGCFITLFDATLGREVFHSAATSLPSACAGPGAGLEGRKRGFWAHHSAGRRRGATAWNLRCVLASYLPPALADSHSRLRPIPVTTTCTCWKKSLGLRVILTKENLSLVPEEKGHLSHFIPLGGPVPFSPVASLQPLITILFVLHSFSTCLLYHLLLLPWRLLPGSLTSCTTCHS